MATEAQRVSKARTRLLLDSPWFGSLAMRLHVEESPERETLSTDGTTLWFNPAYTSTLSDAELVGILAHEVMHCALLHPYRIEGRDIDIWNQACDYAVNPLLSDGGFELPKGILNDPQYRNLSAEQIYSRLTNKPKQQQGKKPTPQPGQIQAPAAPQPGQGDEPGDDPGQGKPTSRPMTATDWKIATEQATAITEKAGKMPGDVARTISTDRESRANWREILRRFIEQTIPQDYSWLTPNRRHVANGVYLPGIRKENTPRIAVGVDTSGSTQAFLDLFACELTAILHETLPVSMEVIYCDSMVQHVETFTPDDPAVKLTFYGGGGTAFQPVFDHIAASDEEPPACLIYFTDLYGDNPVEPEYPVLWATTEGSDMQGPFGETIRVSPFE